MNPILSFISANFVARQLGYNMTEGWMQGDAATQEYFRPIDTFAQRFDDMLGEITGLGFSAVDIWTAQLHPLWATDEHLVAASSALQRRGLVAPSLAASITLDEQERENLARIAAALGARVIGGGCAAPLLNERRADLIRYLEKHDLVLGFENHPEKTPAEVLAKIGDEAGGRIGIAADTGWFGTQGYDAADALREIGPRLVHVHLKDIHAPQIGGGPTLKDMGHETCALGDGVVPIQRCLAVLNEIGYAGALGIEHEPEDHDPAEDVRLSLSRVKSWLGV